MVKGHFLGTDLINWSHEGEDVKQILPAFILELVN